MEAQYSYDEDLKCEACGEDLGRQQVWTLVFSDDPAEVVERALSGTINWCRCPFCDFDGAWLWPSTFLFIDTPENRAVCVTLAKGAAQQLGVLRDALDIDLIRRRGLDPERLLARTKIVQDYREIAEASKLPIERIEQENDAILKYLERSELSGRPRIEKLIESLMNTGAISLEAEEFTPEFLKELEQYRSGLTGQEDRRVPQVLDQLVEHFRAQLRTVRKTLPRRDGVSAIAEVFNSTQPVTQKRMAQSLFESHLAEGKREALQLRLVRLCELQSSGLLRMRDAAPIDLRPELSSLVDALIAGQGLETTSLSENDRRMLPEVKEFLGALAHEPLLKNLREPGPDVSGPPPSWCNRAEKVLEEMDKAKRTGFIPSSVLDRVADSLLASAYVHTELGRRLMKQGLPSGAMHHLTTGLNLMRGVLKTQGESPDYWTARLYAVCLERLGSLQFWYGRFEDSIKALHTARSVYEQIRAPDGILNSLREEASIWLELGQLQRAEELFTSVVRRSEGGGRADEFRDLMNLADVYRRLQPYMEAQLTLSTSKREGGPQPTLAGNPVDDSGNRFEKMGGIGISVRVEGHDDLVIRDVVGSEQVRLVYRALAVATLNDDAAVEQVAMGRLVKVYSEQGCAALASMILDRILENSTLEKAGWEAQMFVYNRLGGLAASHEEAGELERARATREEQLQVLEFILQGEELQPLMMGEMRGEKACLLEALGRAEEARREYHATIEILERSRAWMRDPDNKRGLQSHRWHPYVRAVRNSLRMYSVDRSRDDLLIEAWHDIQAGRSRVMMDAVAAQKGGEVDSAGIGSVRPTEFKEISARLSNDVAILEYFLMPSSPGCPGSWGMFVTETCSDKPWLAWQEPAMERVLEAQRNLANVANEYEETVIQEGLSSVAHDLEQKYITALEVLADVLLPRGLPDQLRARGYRRLVIVADAYLHEVPFAALRPIQAGERAYLGWPSERSGFQIVYAPSSSIFGHWSQRASERNAGTRRRAALFVDPLGDLAESNPALAQIFSSIEDRLRGCQAEVTRFDERTATPNTWLNEGRECDLVVYFGHSIAGPENTERAALELNDGSGEIAAITADDIYRASSQALFSKHSLFIFASCSSGLVSAGAWDSDRELRGLSIAHLYAGCGAVIAASRPLLDSPTLVLLDALITELLAGVNAANGLTEAQIKLASQPPYAHPHFWGYVGLMGAPDWRFVE